MSEDIQLRFFQAYNKPQFYVFRNYKGMKRESDQVTDLFSHYFF